MKHSAFIFIDSLRVMIFVSVQLLIAITNSILMKRGDKFEKSNSQAKVSMLVPTRNEERTIKQCVQFLLSQTYDNLEIIVLNDDSTDQTAEILNRIKSPKLRVIGGKDLPGGWIGKSWACEQLSEQAGGDYVLFIDADTILEPDTIRCAMSVMTQEKLDLLTLMIKNQTASFGEQITVPFATYSIFTILPLAIPYLFPRSQTFCTANGKFMLFRKQFYDKIGGHRSIFDNAVEDIALAKLVKKNSGKWRMYDGSKLISSRMYDSFQEAYQGFTKNYFALFNYRLLVALFVWFWIGLITYYPFGFIVSSLIKGSYQSEFYYAIIAIIITALLWLLTSIKFRFPKRFLVYYPVIIAIAIITGLRSIILTISGKTVWKDRIIKRRRFRLI